MGAQQQAVISELLRELYAKLEAQGGWGTTFEARDVGGREVYLHVNEIFIGLWGPFERAQVDALLAAMNEFLPCTLDGFNEGEEIAFSIELLPVDEMTAVIDGIFLTIYELNEDYEVSGELMDMM